VFYHGGVDLFSPELYSNRELSWLEFNRRVLAMADKVDVPVLERLKFVAIAASNLDEFYMVRVGSLERQLEDGDPPFEPGPDGLSLQELLGLIHRSARGLGHDVAALLSHRLIPKLAESGIAFVTPGDVGDALREKAHDYYQREVHPCLTPIGIDPSHPFPSLRNLGVNLALRVVPKPADKKKKSIEYPEGELLAIVQVPPVLPRFIRFSDGSSHRYLALEDIIAMFAGDLFPGHKVVEASAFRITRASDLEIIEEESEDLLSTIRDELRRRERGMVVRLGVSEHTSEELAESLMELCGCAPRHLHRNPGYLALTALSQVYGELDLPKLKDAPYTPVLAAPLRYSPTLFRSIQEKDVLLHHPYESFAHVVDFINQAAADPDVVAIKQTLYRTSGDSPIVRALARAAEAGKQVTALVELKARFDEAANIKWAEALEKSGVHVVYGLIGLKTHCKILLVVRREGQTLRRYVHLATGNYNPSTARVYTDIGIFTAREDLTFDALRLFNVLTGYAELPHMERLIVAPFTMRRTILDRIDREIAHAKAGRPAAIRAKMNSLVDAEVIRALYRASQAGVEIELLVRGICCLRPGVKGVSETIWVRSIIDRFLEHARIYWWKNGGNDEVYLSSADWMERNLNRRIEVMFPVLDPDLAKRVMEEIFPTEWEDNTFAWKLGSDGSYERLDPKGRPAHRAQTALMERARARSKELLSVRPELQKPGMSPALRAAVAQLLRRSAE
jgi:polyphosphate kinase